MAYDVHYSENARKELRKIDRHQAKIILAWIEKNLIGCENPRRHGASLGYDRKGEWRYRIGSYRLIARIHDNIVVIEIINIGHRREVYD